MPVLLKIFLLFCFFLASICKGQDNTKHEFSGFLKLADSSLITYKISFRFSGEQTIEGYSLTDVFGTEKTKTSIKGSWAKKKKVISFREINNIATKSDAEENEFCYVQVKDAKVKTKGGKSIIEGLFNGEFSSGKSCANGSVFLIGTNFITDKYSEKDSLKQTSSSSIQSIIQKSNETKLHSDETLVVNTSSSKIFLEIWDGLKEDNDQISVLVNNLPVLTDFELTKTKKIIEIPLDKPECLILIVAGNEGKAPPNTAHILLRNDDITTPLVTSLKKGQKVIIKIKQKKIE